VKLRLVYVLNFDMIWFSNSINEFT